MQAWEVRHLLFAKSIELRCSNPNQLLIRGLDYRINQYKLQVGIKTYLSQILAEWATCSVNRFRFFQENGQEILIEGELLLNTLVQYHLLPFQVVEIETNKEKYL